MTVRDYKDDNKDYHSYMKQFNSGKNRMFNTTGPSIEEDTPQRRQEQSSRAPRYKKGLNSGKRATATSIQRAAMRANLSFEDMRQIHQKREEGKNVPVQYKHQARSTRNLMADSANSFNIGAKRNLRHNGYVDGPMRQAESVISQSTLTAQAKSVDDAASVGSVGSIGRNSATRFAGNLIARQNQKVARNDNKGS